MARLIGKTIGLIANLIMIPFVVVFAIPMGILKARRVQKSRLLFTGEEQVLLEKAQRVINMKNNGLLSPDRDLLEVARCIEDARCEYQIIKSRERFDALFSEFVKSKIEECNVFDWENVIGYFDLSLFPVAASSADEYIDRANPKGDNDIRSLIVRIAESGKSNCRIPKLSYGRINDFVDKYSNGTEWFANYVGLRFWVDIGDSEYAVYVDNLDPSKEDVGSVAISASLAGPAQQVAAGGV